jgi:hypothetical protein
MKLHQATREPLYLAHSLIVDGHMLQQLKYAEQQRQREIKKGKRRLGGQSWRGGRS